MSPAYIKKIPCDSNSIIAFVKYYKHHDWKAKTDLKFQWKPELPASILQACSSLPHEEACKANHTCDSDLEGWPVECTNFAFRHSQY